MKHLLLALAAYAAAVFQSGAWFRLPVGDAPVLFLPLVLMLAVFLLEGWPAVIWAAGIGLLSDALGSGPLGLHMLCTVFIGGIVLHVYRRDSRRSTAIDLLFAASMVFLLQMLSLSLSVAVEQRTVAPKMLFCTAAAQGLGSVAAGAVLLLLWNAVRPLVPRRRTYSGPSGV